MILPTDKFYEYKEIRFAWNDFTEKELNKLGIAGWQLVAVTQEMDGQCDSLRAVCLRYTFIRELKNF